MALILEALGVFGGVEGLALILVLQEYLEDVVGRNPRVRPGHAICTATRRKGIQKPAIQLCAPTPMLEFWPIETPELINRHGTISRHGG